MTNATDLPLASLLSLDLRALANMSLTPSMRSLLFLPIFLLASGIQHDAHTHLATLRKYSLPTHPMFQLVVCPHYTAECVIYLSMALLGAPPGQWFNWTIVAALVFVTTNLGVTAKGTKQWYADKFGLEAVRRRYTMVPFVW